MSPMFRVAAGALLVLGALAWITNTLLEIIVKVAYVAG